MECSGLCKNPASFPVMCYLIDFIDIAHTVHNFIRRTKLISSFFKEEIELIISKTIKFIFRSVIFHAIFGSGNSIILGYSVGMKQSKISCFQVLSALRQLELSGFISGPHQEVYITRSHAEPHGSQLHWESTSHIG